MECFVIFVMAWCWFNATESKPQNVVPHYKPMITTKRNFLKFYLSISFAFLFFNALGTFMIYTYFDLINKGKSEIKTLFMLLFGIAVILMAFYTVWQYFRNSPTIKIDKHKITFNKNEYFD